MVFDSVKLKDRNITENYVDGKSEQSSNGIRSKIQIQKPSIFLSVLILWSQKRKKMRTSNCCPPLTMEIDVDISNYNTRRMHINVRKKEVAC